MQNENVLELCCTTMCIQIITLDCKLKICQQSRVHVIGFYYVCHDTWFYYVCFLASSPCGETTTSSIFSIVFALIEDVLKINWEGAHINPKCILASELRRYLQRQKSKENFMKLSVSIFCFCKIVITIFFY